MRNAPVYTDGCFDAYRIVDDDTTDYPRQLLTPLLNDPVWYREVSIFDRTRYELEERGKEVTLKIRIPQYRGIDSGCAVVIAGAIHQVYNAAHFTNKQGFPETELTLISPSKNLVLEAGNNDDVEG